MGCRTLTSRLMKIENIKSFSTLVGIVLLVASCGENPEKGFAGKDITKPFLEKINGTYNQNGSPKYRFNKTGDFYALSQNTVSINISVNRGNTQLTIENREPKKLPNFDNLTAKIQNSDQFNASLTCHFSSPGKISKVVEIPKLKEGQNLIGDISWKVQSQPLATAILSAAVGSSIYETHQFNFKHSGDPANYDGNNLFNYLSLADLNEMAREHCKEINPEVLLTDKYSRGVDLAMKSYDHDKIILTPYGGADQKYPIEYLNNLMLLNSHISSIDLTNETKKLFHSNLVTVMQLDKDYVFQKWIESNELFSFKFDKDQSILTLNYSLNSSNCAGQLNFDIHGASFKNSFQNPGLYMAVKKLIIKKIDLPSCQKFGYQPLLDTLFQDETQTEFYIKINYVADSTEPKVEGFFVLDIHPAILNPDTNKLEISPSIGQIRNLTYKDLIQ